MIPKKLIEELLGRECKRCLVTPKHCDTKGEEYCRSRVVEGIILTLSAVRRDRGEKMLRRLLGALLVIEICLVGIILGADFNPEMNFRLILVGVVCAALIITWSFLLIWTGRIGPYNYGDNEKPISRLMLNMLEKGGRNEMEIKI